MTCLGCKTDLVDAGFCMICEIRMVPKLYDCPRCKQFFCTSSFEVACEGCRTLEESQELLAKWPEMRRFM